MRLGKRTRRDQEIATLRGQVDELRELATARLGVIDRLAEKAAELERDRTHLADALGRLENDLRDVVDRLDAAPATSEPVLGPSGPQAEERPATEPDPAGERDDSAEPQLSEKQAALVAAVNELQEASTGEIARHVGRDGEGDAVSMALQKLKRMGLVAHNGRRAKGARWLALRIAPRAAEPAAATAPPPPVRAATPTAPATEPTPDLTELDERILRLVAQHGPVTHLYIADQLVKNRRETGARMRELARNGLLVDLDGAFATPDLAEAA